MRLYFITSKEGHHPEWSSHFYRDIESAIDLKSMVGPGFEICYVEATVVKAGEDGRYRTGV